MRDGVNEEEAKDDGSVCINGMLRSERRIDDVV